MDASLHPDPERTLDAETAERMRGDLVARALHLAGNNAVHAPWLRLARDIFVHAGLKRAGADRLASVCGRAPQRSH